MSFVRNIVQDEITDNFTLRNVHDGDRNSGYDVGDQVVLDVVVEEPVREGQILVQNLLPFNFSAAANLVPYIRQSR